MISDLEKMEVMIGSSRFDTEIGNSVRRPESPSFDALVDHT